MFTNIAENPAAPLPRVPSPTAKSPSGREPALIRSLVESVSRSHNVDPDLVMAMMKTESDYNRWAVSPKGAMGLMQLIPETGRRFGVQDFFDPLQNIQGGVRYLRFLLDKFNGNIELALAAYNAGENLVARIGRIPSIEETQNYVRKIRSIYTKPSASLEYTAPAAVQTGGGPAPATGATEIARTEAAPIFRTVDERGVVRFSNVGP